MHLDIVFPAHNEEDRIRRTLIRYRKALPEPSIRFIVALDGCVDGTADEVVRQRCLDARVQLLDLPKLGKGGVLAEGMRRCDAPIVAFVDADGATPPGELARLAEHVAIGRADVVIGSRRHPASITPAPRRLDRRITSIGFAAAVHRLFHLDQADTQCGAKALSADAVRRLVPLISSRDFLFDVDLLVTAQRLGLRIEEVPTIWIDQDGSKLDAVHDARRMAASALRLWVHHRVLPVHPDAARSADANDEVIDLLDHLVTDERRDDERLVGA